MNSLVAGLISLLSATFMRVSLTEKSFRLQLLKSTRLCPAPVSSLSCIHLPRSENSLMVGVDTATRRFRLNRGNEH
jgi:hypothetical protein